MLLQNEYFRNVKSYLEFAIGHIYIFLKRNKTGYLKNYEIYLWCTTYVHFNAIKILL